MTMSTIIWILAVFWAALPLPVIGWGVFDFEPMKTCCTLDYTQGDRYMMSYTKTHRCYFFPDMKIYKLCVI